MFNEKCYFTTRLLKGNVESIEHMSKTDQDVSNIVLKYFSNVALVNIVFYFNVECYKFDSLTKTFVSDHTNITDQENIQFNVLKGKLRNSFFKASNREMEVHKCKSGEYVSRQFYHDGHPHCASKDDESGLTCFINHQKLNNHSFCKTLRLRPKCTYSEMYYQSQHGGCNTFGNTGLIKKFDNITKYGDTGVNYVFDDRITFPLVSMSNSEESTVKEAGQYSILHNLYSYCTKEELDLRNYSKQESYFVSKCKSLNELQCNNMFKCHQSYCIPYRYLTRSIFISL